MAEAAGTRVVGIDLGQRRIGVSVSDSQRVLATPHAVIERSGDLDADHRAIAAVVAEFGAGVVVVGLPLSLAGDRGPAASAAAAEASRLGAQLNVPVVLHDERLTTVEAERRRRLPAAPVGARGGERARSQARPLRQNRPGAATRARRVGIDAVAATVLLQSWLEENRGK
ncbi:MAG: Holliday junction resolvase RuvX [Acidimicrobiales bacterium]|jgi:putative Holliday junction resolvase